MARLNLKSQISNLKSISKIFKIRVFMIVLLSTLYFVLCTPVSAQVPANTTIKCDQISDEEFHSLRPYQANTQCVTATSNFANYCGNDLTLTDEIEVYYPGTDGSCEDKNGQVYCNYNVTITRPNIKIDLEGADLPIMGNTEDVINSQNKISGDEIEEALPDTEKINSYVSWYLSGTTNKAEYPYLDTSSESKSKIVDFSGPINKLLPQDIQFASRAATVTKAGVSRHDQIVGCSLNIETPNILGVVGEIFDIGKIQLVDIPVSCDLAGIESLAITKHRLSDWDKESNLPPLMSDAKYKDNYGKYLKDYKEWRGNFCVLVTVPSFVPVVGNQSILVCVDNKFKSKFNSYLFNNIPMSSTEDTKGEIYIDQVSSATSSSTEAVAVKNVTFSNQSPATLYFSHMEESNELGSLLQDTYAPKGVDKAGNPSNISNETSCKSVEVRSNKGDDLFATEISGDLTYTASFACIFNQIESVSCFSSCVNSGGDRDECRYECAVNPETIPISTDTQTCKKTARITLSTSSNVPLVDDIWSRLVAGPMAVFKRIFPKTNTEGSVGKIMDIAGGTNIAYTGTGISQANTDLKLPHIGGVSEYFLKGIQTALRPKGFGEPITFEDVTSTSISCSNPTSFDSLNLQGATDNACKICGYNIPPTLQKIIESAAQKYGVPGSVILGTMYHEGAFSRGLEWTDENVKKWSTCGASVPGCDKDATSVAQIPFGWIPYFFYGDSRTWGASQSVDPARTKETSSPCNVIDGIYATAAALKMWSGGLSTSVKYPSSYPSGQNYSRFPDFCYNWDLNNGTGQPGTCSSWNENTVATSEVGYGGYCPEIGKHPIGSAFPDDNPFLTRVVSYYNQYSCH